MAAVATSSIPTTTLTTTDNTMAVDPSIILGIKQPQFQQPDPLEQAGGIMRLKALMGQGELQGLQTQVARRGLENEEATRSAYRDAGGDATRLRVLLGDHGLYKQLQALDKFELEKREKESSIGKNTAQAEKYSTDEKIARIERGASILHTVKDQPSYDAARRAMALSFGAQAVAQMPDQYDPQFVQAKIAEGMTIAQRLADQRARDQQAETGRHNLATERTATGNLAVAQGNLGVSRARLSFDQSAGKAPPGYRFTADRNLEAIPGGPADVKAGAAKEKAVLGAEQAAVKAKVVIDKVDEALSKTGFWTTGLPGEIQGKVPGLPAYDLEKALDTIRANIGFKELADMRAASPTGGALGQITVREIEFLQAAIANLDKGQSEDRLRQNLQAVKTHFENWKKAMDMAAGKTPGASGDFGMPDMSAIDAEIARRRGRK